MFLIVQKNVELYNFKVFGFGIFSVAANSQKDAEDILQAYFDKKSLNVKWISLN